MFLDGDSIKFSASKKFLSSLMIQFQSVLQEMYSRKLLMTSTCVSQHYQPAKSLFRKWKVPLTLAMTFLLFHVCIVTMFGEESTFLKDYDLNSNIHDSNRWKRSADLKNVPPNLEGSPPVHRNRDLNQYDHNELVSSINRKICIKGHIQGMRSVCFDQPCLHQLKDFQGYPLPKNIEVFAARSSMDKLQQHFIHRHILSVQGTLDSINFPLTSLLVDFQKYLGVRGAVGLIQTKLDKFSSFLASSVDQSLEEKLVVVHSFNASNRPFSSYSAYVNSFKIPTDKELYAQHLMEIGFSSSNEHDSVSKEFYLIDDVTPIFPTGSLSKLEIPQFRIVSVSSDLTNSVNLISGLESAACNLRDGGLVILNFEGHDVYSVSSVNAVLENKFGSSLSVLAATFNKIFITTTNWKNKYVELIREHSVSLRSGLTTFDIATGHYKQS